MPRAVTAITYPIIYPMIHTTDDLQNVIYGYSMGQDRAKHGPGGNLNNGIDH